MLLESVVVKRKESLVISLCNVVEVASHWH